MADNFAFQALYTAFLAEHAEAKIADQRLWELFAKAQSGGHRVGKFLHSTKRTPRQAVDIFPFAQIPIPASLQDPGTKFIWLSVFLDEAAQRHSGSTNGAVFRECIFLGLKTAKDGGRLASEVVGIPSSTLTDSTRDALIADGNCYWWAYIAYRSGYEVFKKHYQSASPNRGRRQSATPPGSRGTSANNGSPRPSGRSPVSSGGSGSATISRGR